MIARLILLFITFFPLLSFAEDTSSTSSTSFTPPATDYSVIFLSNIFGLVDGVLHGTGSQIMGTIFGVLNASILALIALLIMYAIIVGTMNTAHEGTMLGQKWSSIYIPIRATVGLGFVIPKSSGYCLMQILVMWVVVQGVGAADKIWNATLDYLNRGGVFMQAQMSENSSTSSNDNASIITLNTGAGMILNGLTCMQGLEVLLNTQRNYYLSLADTSNSGPCSEASLADPATSSSMVYFCNNAVPDFIGTINAVDYANQTFVSACSSAYVPGNGAPYDLPMPYFTTSPYSDLNGSCGHLRWNDFNPDLSASTTLSCGDVDTTRQSRPAAVQQMISDFTPVALEIINNDPQITTTASNSGGNYSNIAANQFGVSLLSAGGTNYCTTPSTDCVGWGPDAAQTNQSLIFTGFELQNTVNDYNAIMMPALNLVKDLQNSENANQLREFIATAQDVGWIMAGSYFFNLVYLNGKVTTQYDAVDPTSGLDMSTFQVDASFPFVFPAPSSGPSSCTTTLCIFFNGDTAPVTALAALYNGSSLGITSASHNNASTSAMTVDTNAVAYSDQFSSTVYGFITDEAMVHLPGQPGLTTPYFKMNFNIQPGKTLLTFPKKHFSGFFGPVLNGIYNTIFRSIINEFLGFITDVFNLVIQAFLYVPLNLMMVIFNNGIKLLQTTMVHPIIALAYMGSLFINTSVEIWFGLISFSVIFGVTGSGLADAVFFMIFPFLISWLGVMVAVGFIDAYYVPFVPYMIFTFGSIAWLMAVIEVMIAGPIIALGIAHPEGHDAFGKAEQAVMILANVFLRPTMMIIGYVAAISLSYVTIFILNSGFVNIISFLMPPEQFATTTSEGGISGMPTPYFNWSAIYASFFCLVTYTSIYLTVVQKSFTLISMIPDKILRWIGSQAESYGQETAQWTEDIKTQTKEAGEATAKVSSNIGASAMGAVEKIGSAAAKGTKKEEAGAEEGGEGGGEQGGGQQGGGGGPA